MNRLATDIFSHPESFQSAFINGLTQILEQHSLGAFILACANASGQTVLASRLGASLEAEFRRLSNRLLDGDTAGNAEDQQVFRQLMELGLENLPPTRVRSSGDWQLQFNAMRAFRPMRHAASAPPGLLVPFNPEGFHFNKPFMLTEQLWEGQGYGHGLSAYYNKYPFADYHLLWVPDRELGLAQYLTRPYHQLIWQLTAELDTTLPGFTMAYNALGAFASVNHMHFQSYVGEDLPITAAHWRHNGGDRSYPVRVYRFDDADEAWLMIEQLHAAEQAYNLLYRSQTMYVIPRLAQGLYQQPDWSPGFAWRELCGDIVTTREADFEKLQGAVIHKALSRLQCGIDFGG